MNPKTHLTNVQTIAVDTGVGVLETGDVDPALGSDRIAGITGNNDVGVSREAVVTGRVDA